MPKTACPTCQHPMKMLRDHRGELHWCPHCGNVHFPETATDTGPPGPPGRQPEATV